MAANGATFTAPTPKEKRVVVLGGTFLSLYCSFTTKLETAPLAAAPRIARAPRSCPAELTDWRPTTSATPTNPTMSPTAWTQLISALRSKRRAKTATNIGVDETSTPARPEGTEVSPREIRMKGAAMASSPSIHHWIIFGRDGQTRGLRGVSVDSTMSAWERIKNLQRARKRHWWPG
jgi:hypothetical protein